MSGYHTKVGPKTMEHMRKSHQKQWSNAKSLYEEVTS